MLRRNYSIKSGYKIRQENAPYIDEQPSGLVYQPHVYELAIFLAQKSGCKYIIDIGAGNGEKLRKAGKNIDVIAIDYAPNIKALRKNLPKAKVIDFSLENGIPKIADEIVKNAVVISSDVIEHIVEPHKYLKGLSRISKLAPFVLISTPDRTRARGPESFGPPQNPFHVREWTIDELYLLFKKYGITCKIGHSVSNNLDLFKGTILAVSGTQAIPTRTKKLDSVLGIITAYNEDDIVEQTVMHLLNQGVDVHVIENWSTDNTYKIVSKLARKHKNVTVERFPAKKPKQHKYEWERLLEKVEEVAELSKHDWVIHNDADEFRVSPWKDVTLQEALTFVSSCGYSAIDFTIAEFRPTKDGYKGKEHPDAFFYNFEFTPIEGYFLQIKGWKYNGRVQLASSGGHSAEFPERKVFPFKFTSKHYPLRSVAQAKRKIFKDRLSRFTEEEKKRGWHVQYNSFNKDDEFLWEERHLQKFTPDYFYNEYIVELISGIGIRP